LNNSAKIDPYNFELYRFKVWSFLRHSVDEVFGLSQFKMHGFFSLRSVGTPFDTIPDRDIVRKHSLRYT